MKIPLKYTILLAGVSRRESTRNVILKASGNSVKYDRLCAAYDREFAPTGKLQERMVHELVDLRWRLDHVRAYVDRCHTSPAPLDRATLRGLREIARYERRLLKQYDDIFSDFYKYQRQSKAA